MAASMCWRMWRNKKTVSSELKFPAQETKNQETCCAERVNRQAHTCPLRESTPAQEGLPVRLALGWRLGEGPWGGGRLFFASKHLCRVRLLPAEHFLWESGTFPGTAAVTPTPTPVRVVPPVCGLRDSTLLAGWRQGWGVWA